MRVASSEGWHIADSQIGPGMPLRPALFVGRDRLAVEDAFRWAAARFPMNRRVLACEIV
jgi:hypothetical protein